MFIENTVAQKLPTTAKKVCNVVLDSLELSEKVINHLEFHINHVDLEVKLSPREQTVFFKTRRPLMLCLRLVP